VHARIVVFAAIAVLSVPAAAAGAVDAGQAFRFGTVPQRAVQGQLASLSVVVQPTGVLCAASVRYANGAVQRLAAVRARANKASWRFKVPANASPGAATANIACNRAGKGVRRFSVVAAPKAPEAARVTVRNSGFSQRVRSTTRYVSYGVELQNHSPESDALDVTVLVNFLDANGRVVDTDSSRIGAVAAGSVYYHGGSTTIPDASFVSRIEIVTRVEGQSPKRKLGPPFADILIQASKAEPAWVGAVVGQIENDHGTHMLTRTAVSAVIYDSGGAIIGGTSGYMGEQLLPGVRAYFQASRGANSIPFDRAFAASVSTLASYRATS
jgi:hypothetical protein